MVLDLFIYCFLMFNKYFTYNLYDHMFIIIKIKIFNTKNVKKK